MHELKNLSQKHGYQKRKTEAQKRRHQTYTHERQRIGEPRLAVDIRFPFFH